MAKKRFGLPEDGTVMSCFQTPAAMAFWVHLFLVSHETQNIVIDSASIGVNRRKRRDKSAIVLTPRSWCRC